MSCIITLWLLINFILFLIRYLLSMCKHVNSFLTSRWRQRTLKVWIGKRWPLTWTVSCWNLTQSSATSNITSFDMKICFLFLSVLLAHLLNMSNILIPNRWWVIEIQVFNSQGIIMMVKWVTKYTFWFDFRWCAGHFTRCHLASNFIKRYREGRSSRY